MGRIPKVDKERALEEARRKEQDRQLHDHMRQLQQQRGHPATVMVSTCINYNNNGATQPQSW